MSPKSSESDSEFDKWPAKGIIDEKQDEYLVDWDGVDPNTKQPYLPTWEPKKNCKELVAAWISRGEPSDEGGPEEEEEEVEDEAEYTNGTRRAHPLILGPIPHPDRPPSSFSLSVLTPGSTLAPDSKVGPPRGIKRVADLPCRSFFHLTAYSSSFSSVTQPRRTRSRGQTPTHVRIPSDHHAEEASYQQDEEDAPYEDEEEEEGQSDRGEGSATHPFEISSSPPQVLGG